ncbi:MAG: hypothetical protein PHV43_02885 [Candidatus Colwellbacteria bacterium]|nr:hypothetical protein [Candidatus Colwellbacteria bacterium]
MEQEEFEQLAGEQKLGEIYRSVEQTRKYLKWTFIATLIFFVLPLLGLGFILPRFIDMITGMSLGLF